MAFSEAWVEADPDGSVITVSLLDNYQRAAKRQIRERLEGDPATLNSGIFEVGTFGTTAIVRAGTARAYMVTAAALGTLTLQDGRIAITSDTNRLYHLKGSGLVELSYVTLDGTRPITGYATFNVGFAVLAGGITISGASLFNNNLAVVGQLSGGTIVGPLTGNASTATVLATARDINGVSFNGSANITVPAAAGTLTGAALAAGVTSSSLTSVGTLISLGVTGNITAGSFTGPLTGAVLGNVTGTLTGNASSATVLQVARNINGISFDGSANITVAAAAGTLTGAALPAGVTASSLTSVGTLVALAVTGQIDAGSLTVGGGAIVSKILSATKVWDAPSTASGAFSSTTVAVPGATPGDPVLIEQAGARTAIPEFVVHAYVSAADTVTILWPNRSLSSEDPISCTFRVIVFHI